MFVVIHHQEVHRRQALRRTLLFANRENSGGPFELRANHSACVRIRHRASSLGTVLRPYSVDGEGKRLGQFPFREITPLF